LGAAEAAKLLAYREAREGFLGVLLAALFNRPAFRMALAVLGDFSQFFLSPKKYLYVSLYIEKHPTQLFHIYGDCLAASAHFNMEGRWVGNTLTLDKIQYSDCTADSRKVTDIFCHSTSPVVRY
jgi:hypothetical protein